jgi:hypothetical protein
MTLFFRVLDVGVDEKAAALRNIISTRLFGSGFAGLGRFREAPSLIG